MLFSVYKRKNRKFVILQNAFAYISASCAILPVAFTWGTENFNFALKFASLSLTVFVGIFWASLSWIRENAPDKEDMAKLDWVEKRLSELEFGQDQIYQESLIVLAQIETLKEELSRKPNSTVVSIRPREQFKKVLENVQIIYPKLKDRRRSERLRHVINCFLEVFEILKSKLSEEEKLRVAALLEDVKVSEEVGVASVGWKAS